MALFRDPEIALNNTYSSSGGKTMPFEEPAGWRELQEKAQNERDTKKLIKIIDQMNALLTEHEKRVAAGERSEQPLESAEGNQE